MPSIETNGRDPMPHDFQLPTDTGDLLVFDAALRAESPTLLFFYRGWW